MVQGVSIPALAFIAMVLVVAVGETQPVHGGSKRQLDPCPASPNCVSTMSTDFRHAIDPLKFTGPPEAALSRIREIVRNTPRSTIDFEDEGYIHAEFRTFLGFVDDVEFLLDRSARVIHMRSASRLGYWDLGVNRKRLEGIRQRFMTPFDG